MQALAIERTLTELDHVRLSRLIDPAPRGRIGPRPAQPLADLLDASRVVPSREVSPQVVTMNSQVVLRDPRSGQDSTLTLSYPGEAEPAAGRVSVLSPVGQSLLGLPVGATARWQTLAGDERSARIVALLFQPEASGDYTR
jgi:regulator of nucleoside diphosphate kinase